MIDLKKCNYITGDADSVSRGISKIVNFLENDGYSCLLLTLPKTYTIKSSNLYHHINNKKTFITLENFKSIVQNASNLFRINLLILDFWHLNKSDISSYKEEADKLNIPYMIVAKEYYYKLSNDITDYHFSTEYNRSTAFSNSQHVKVDILVTDKINNTCNSIDSLSKTYIRNKKIDDIFGDFSN